MAEAGPRQARIAILNPSDIQTHLFRLIDEAERRIVLVSPYVRIDKLRNLVRYIQSALKRKVQVSLFVRVKDFSTGNEDVMASEALAQLRQDGLDVQELKDLHAKIYFSEKHALITSLNLLESSFNNSIEIGTWLLAGTPEYEAVATFLKREIEPTATKVAAPAISPAPSPPTQPSEPIAPKRPPRAASTRESRPPPKSDDIVIFEGGHCIRCGDELDFNMDRPLCRDCHGVWKQYGAKDYPEKFCHGCGAPKKTSVARPLCSPCFKELPAILDDEDIAF
ncbi:phospholipase D-like domain-containing protein [Corallococcus terminator]|uniref:phospholipase D-like domain-containing protein n=1 Tax=Corallococcus terminator TaxID=2316733 RepID=UPI00131589CF|nr:phospholipase D-like domain-containing protein [Corallococcus terminator]